MRRSIILVVGLLTFVSGQTTPEHGTGCDVAVLRLEKMLSDLTGRVNDLENQRQADVIEMSDIRREMAKVKSQNRGLKTELDNMTTTKCDRQSPDPDTQSSTLVMGVDTGVGTVSGGASVGFYARLGHDLSDVAKEQVIHYENVVTNNGGQYSPHSGVFTCRTEGTYVFSWTVYALYNHWSFTELVKNGHAVANNRAGDKNLNAASSTTAMINLSPGDMVWTRVYNRSPGAGILASISMFCGFKL